MPIDFEEPDIFAIGFQEIVPLTAQQILQTDPDKRLLSVAVKVGNFAYTPTGASGKQAC